VGRGSEKLARRCRLLVLVAALAAAHSCWPWLVRRAWKTCVAYKMLIRRRLFFSPLGVQSDVADRAGMDVVFGTRRLFRRSQPYGAPEPDCWAARRAWHSESADAR